MLPLKSFFAAAVLLTVTGEARASAVQLDFSREGAPRCPDEQAFKDVVAARLGSDPFVVSSPMRLVITMVRSGHGFEGRAELRDGQEVRWSEPTPSLRDCVQVVRALGLAVAVRLRELPADAQSVTPAPSPDIPRVRPEAPPVRVVVGPAPAPVADRRASSPGAGNARVGVDGGLALGSVPGDVSAELAASGGYRWGVFSLSGEVRWTTPGSSAQARGTRLVGGVVPCGHWAITSSLEILTCGVAQAGALFGSPLGGLHPDDTLVLAYFGLGTRFGLDIPIMPSRLALRFGADAIVTVVRPQFALDRRVVWATSFVTGVVGAGVVISF